MMPKIFSFYVAALPLFSLTALAAPPAKQSVVIETVSTRPEYVTGGDVLVKVTVPQTININKLRATVSGRDITSAFHTTAEPRVLMGLISGLPEGTNSIKVGGSVLEVTNYPVSGPVFSGPQQQPFICQTETFKLPDGTTLGSAIDTNCAVKTVVQYVYLPDGKNSFQPLRNLKVVPPDVAETTISTGKKVRFIVRVETATIDRGIYQSAILHDPFLESMPSPFAPPAGWNRRLVAVHGSGCTGGWYVQGGALGVSPIDRDRLAKGFAVYTNTLNHPTNSCNAILAAEAAVMGKEHFIEMYGVPDWTISTGGSGGAYTSLQIADAFPGMFDGVLIRQTFPDALTLALSGLDGHLLMHAFETAPAGKFTEKQKVAIGGYANLRAMRDAANQAGRTDPTPDRKDIEGYQSAVWRDVVPKGLRYDPETNPRGIRPTVFDAAKNIYGTNLQTGAALRPFDNVGVQYGLNALNDGVITPAQFLDLNESVGGVDADGSYISSRTVGDREAIEHAYQSGLLLSGQGGLQNIPVVDDGRSDEAKSYHYGWFHFALRERLRKPDGSTSNFMMWRNLPGDRKEDRLFEQWVDAWKRDLSTDTAAEKVRKARPQEAQDGCFDDSEFVRDELPFSSKPVSRCSELYPVYANPRYEAGGPVAANILKCQLIPVDISSYKVSFTEDETTRLKQIFADGVCDFTRPDVYSKPLTPWPSFGPSPVNKIETSAAQAVLPSENVKGK